LPVSVDVTRYLLTVASSSHRASRAGAPIALGSKLASRSSSSRVQIGTGWESGWLRRREDGSVARNQALFRAVAEQIEASNQTFRVTLGDLADFVCECADDKCMERITVTIDQYEALRRFPTHFIVKPGHVYLEFERVVEEIEGFSVVEKFGEAGKQALKLDPRRVTTDLHL
jgi:hypothetical protein